MSNKRQKTRKRKLVTKGKSRIENDRVNKTKRRICYRMKMKIQEI